MFEEIERLTRALCAEHGTSGCEDDVFKVAKKELGFCKEVCERAWRRCGHFRRFEF